MENKISKGLKLNTRLIITFCFIVFMPSFILSLLAISWFHIRKMSEMGLVFNETQAKLMLLHVIIAVIISMTFVAALLILTSYRGIVGPIKELTSATMKMKGGDLDFEIQTSGQTKEIDDLCIHFDEMRKWMKTYMEEKSENENSQRQLISNIGHDLKTPVTAIKGYTEGILDGIADTPEKRDRYLHTILSKANELDRLISELTYYSHIDTQRIPYDFRKIDVSDYFEDCIDELSLDLEGKNFSLVYENNLKEPVMVIADPIQMKKVINNIVGNSLKYNDKKHGEIKIKINDTDEFVLIEIADNGKGIDIKDLPNVFERFYRADSSRNSATGGSGIGLSIVHKIIEDHGGRIWANSQIGKGTKMFIELRKYQERNDENE